MKFTALILTWLFTNLVFALPLCLQSQVVVFENYTTGKFGLKDLTSGRTIVPSKYGFIKGLDHGYFAFSSTGVRRKNDPSDESSFSGLKFGVMDSAGKTILSPAYTRISNLSAQLTFFSSTSAKDPSQPEHEEQVYYISNLKGEIISPKGYCVLGASDIFQIYDHSPAENQVFVPVADLKKKDKRYYLFTKDKIISGPCPYNGFYAHEDGTLTVKKYNGTFDYLQHNKKVNTLPLRQIESIYSSGNEKACYGIDTTHALYRLPIGDETVSPAKVSAGVLSFYPFKPKEELIVLIGKTGSLKPMLLDTTLHENSLKSDYDSLLKASYYTDVERPDQRLLLFALSQKEKVVYVLNTGKILGSAKKFRQEDFDSYLAPGDSILAAREEEKIAEELRIKIAAEKKERMKLPHYGSSYGELSSAIYDNWENVLVTDDRYAYINSYYNKFLVTLDKNDTVSGAMLLDMDLDTLIPEGKFRYIIPSPDGRLAIVGGPAYYSPRRINPEDSLMTDVFTVDEGLYDVTTKKMILPFGKYSSILPDSSWSIARLVSKKYYINKKYDVKLTQAKEYYTSDYGLYSLANKKELSPLKYSYIGPIKNSEMIVFNEGGASYDLNGFGYGGKFGLMTAKGELTCKATYQFIGNVNSDGLAMAMKGGTNHDDFSGGKYIVIDKGGRNIRPNYELNWAPVAKRFQFVSSRPWDENTYYYEDYFGLNDTLDKLRQDSTLAANFNQYLHAERGQGKTMLVILELVDKASVFENIFSSLPKKPVFKYSPEGEITNWGTFTDLKRTELPTYEVVENSTNTPVAFIHYPDSVYSISFRDSSELDYVWPGIYSQNALLRSPKVRRDLHDPARAENLERNGFFIDGIPDTLIHRFKGPCDTTYRVTRFGTYDSETILRHQLFNRYNGLLINETVVLPPIYSFIMNLGDSAFIAIDSLGKAWRYNRAAGSVHPTGERFYRIYNKRSAGEENQKRFHGLLLTKNQRGKLNIYNVFNGEFVAEADSAFPLIQTEALYPDGNYYNVAIKDEESSVLYNDIAIYRNGKGEFYDLRSAFWSTLGDEQASNKLIGGKEFKNIIPFNGVHYDGVFCSDNNKFIYYGDGSASSNSIQIDSVYATLPQFIFYKGKKMYIASVKLKGELMKNKKPRPLHEICLIDSAKSISFLDDGYYLADSICRSFGSSERLSYIPKNFKAAGPKEVTLLLNDPVKAMIHPVKYFIKSENGRNYLMQRISSHVSDIAYVDEQLVKVDSATTFEIAGSTSPSGIYRADGQLKSAKTSKRIPVQDADSIFLLRSGYADIDAYAFSKNKKWSVLICSTKNNDFKISSEFNFSSWQDLNKALFPVYETYGECDVILPHKEFKKLMDELSSKSDRNEPW